MMLLGIVINSTAQIRVFSNGKVGIQADTVAPLSALAVGKATTEDAIRVQTKNTGLIVIRDGNTRAAWSSAIGSTNNLGLPFKAIGVSGLSMYNTYTGRGRAWGVMGQAYNATTGYNYGVMGVLHGDNKHFGAGIVGTVDGNTDVNVPGRFAGYFVGDVKVTGLINGTTVGNSDIRYKQNIVDLGSFSTTQSINGRGSVLKSVLEMNPIQYELKQMYSVSVGDSASVATAIYNENSQLFKNKHYGLIAQELQTLYPDLVYKGEDGYLSVDYIGIIPLLIQSIKELKAEIDMGKSSANDASRAPSMYSNTDDASASVPALFQNTPNPFSQATEIRYFLPSTVNNALLCIYDLNGRQIKQIRLTQRGNGSQMISGSEFSAGIYLYALIADGKEIDIKRMILTE
ncbi:MAG: tail fiber domain-containing protein [Paludibacter sp.]|nr:tail fiber domain-containing protein [Paludibacter sp.]